jgi:hypothetical protein
VAYEHTLGTQVDGVLELDFRHAAKDRVDQDGTLDDDTGGSLLYATPRLLVSLGHGLVLRAGAQVPLAKSLNGYQTERAVANVALTNSILDLRRAACIPEGKGLAPPPTLRSVIRELPAGVIRATGADPHVEPPLGRGGGHVVEGDEGEFACRGGRLARGRLEAEVVEDPANGEGVDPARKPRRDAAEGEDREVMLHLISAENRLPRRRPAGGRS